MTATLAVGAEYAAYRQVLRDNAQKSPADWTFKSNPQYRAILEHVSPQQGEQYIEVIREEFPHLWAQFQDFYVRIALDNDRLGTPVRSEFAWLGVTCSPTNWRYLWHALLFWRHIEELGLKAVDVVEIGGGYGGLALFIRRLAAMQKRILRSYTIIDVPEAGAIQTAFCRELAIPVRVVDGTAAAAVVDLMNDPLYLPYLISMYAFSEFSPEVRAFYERDVIYGCRAGLLAWNMIPLYEFTLHPITSEAERPLTGPGNLLVRF